MSDDAPPLRDAVSRVHEHLQATEALPLETAANRWLGEATAVAADADDPALPPETVRERIEHVQRLLREVDGTGHPEADDHVAAALELVDTILS